MKPYEGQSPMKDKVNVLIEALPYIIKFKGNIIVIKYGGSAMVEEGLKVSFAKDVVLLKHLGMHPVVVHGGGKKISELMKKIGKEPQFVEGQRVTDSETIEIVEMVLSGIINKEIVTNIIKNGGKSVGISGKDNFTVRARKKLHKDIDIGFVGQVEKVNPELIVSLINNGYIPVISPLGVDEDGNSYNINADDVVAEIAVSLKAEKLIYLTDVDGIYRDINDKDSLIPSLSVEDLQNLIDSGIAVGGMIPKLTSIIRAIERGVSKVHIINGTIPHSLLIELFTDEGIGTQITL